MTRPLLCLASAIMAAVSLGAQQPRDNRKPLAVGTASVSGVVRADGSPRMPLRRARVTVSGVEMEFSRTAVTADDGSYTIAGLPPGRVTVIGAKEGYVTTPAGLRKRGLPTAIDIQTGATTRVDLVLPRGAVITGRVTLAGGEPAAGISVTPLVMRWSSLHGQRWPVAAVQPVLTDERGIYRVFGLEEGTYLVSARPPAAMTATQAGLQVMTDAEIRAALAEVRTDVFSARPGIPVPTRTAPRGVGPPPRAVVLAPVYFPGTPIAARATELRLAAGEVRTAVDFELDYVPLATVEGFVSVPAGTPRVGVMMTSADRLSARGGQVDDAGRFTLRNVPPGAYTITARALNPVTGAGFLPLAGSTDVIVNGDDIGGVTISMEPGLTIKGRVQFETEAGMTALPLPRFTIPSVPLTYAVSGMAGPPAIEIEGGTFTATDIVPGPYRLTALARGIRIPIGPWWVTSFVVGGRELLDQEIQLRQSSDDAVLTLSNRVSEINGTAYSAAGSVIREGYIVVFSADPKLWFTGSRYIAGVRPTPAGRFAVRNLPAGDYYIAVTGELAQDEWFDPALLDMLRTEATPVRLGRAEQKVQDVRLR